MRELEKEFAVVQRLDHPNIGRAYALEHFDEVACLVMEYVEGESLRARLKAKGSLPQDQALRIAGLVCEALAYAHSMRTLHCDIKPERGVGVGDLLHVTEAELESALQPVPQPGGRDGGGAPGPAAIPPVSGLNCLD